MQTSWRYEVLHGDAAGFHHRDLLAPPPGGALVPAVHQFVVDRPALVLGSSQPDTDVDAAAAAAAGVEVVRRRSGGGAVLLLPNEVTWLDVVIPVGDLRWHDDVGRAFHWLGRRWAEVLHDLWPPTTATARPVVHEGAMVHSRWSRLVCFAGLGPGEVTAGVGGPKLVGISQRRNRNGARFQCALYTRWRPRDTADLLVVPPEERSALLAALEGATATLPEGLDPTTVVERFVTG